MNQTLLETELLDLDPETPRDRAVARAADRISRTTKPRSEDRTLATIFAQDAIGHDPETSVKDPR